MLPGPEKEPWNKDQVICVKYYPVDNVSYIVNPYKIFPDVPSFKKIEWDTQNNSPGQEVKKYFDLTTREKVFHGSKSITNYYYYVLKSSDLHSNEPFIHI